MTAIKHFENFLIENKYGAPLLANSIKLLWC